jgi:hypothetical protein
MVHGAQMSPWQSLAKVRNALLLALLTTVAAYLIMMLAPFPGIRQMAVFGDGVERLLPDGDFLASVAMSWSARPSCSVHGTNAALACRMATQ